MKDCERDLGRIDGEERTGSIFPPADLDELLDVADLARHDGRGFEGWIEGEGGLLMSPGLEARCFWMMRAWCVK